MNGAALPFVLSDPAPARPPPKAFSADGSDEPTPPRSLVARLFRHLDRAPFARTVPDFLVDAARAQTESEAAARLKGEIRTSMDAFWSAHEEAAYLRQLRTPLGSYREHRRVEDAVADYVERAGFPRLVEKLRACRRSGSLAERAADGKLIVLWDAKCNLARLCPDESGVQSARVAERYLPVVEAWLAGGKGRRVQKAVFTFPNVPAGGLRAAKRAQFAALDRLLRRKVCRNIKGALATQEDPLSRHGDWHAHLNVLLLVDGPLEWGMLRAEWTAVTRTLFPDCAAASFQVELRELPRTLKALRAASREQVKYAAKMVDSGVRALPGDELSGVLPGVDPLGAAPVAGAYGQWPKAPGLVQWPYAAFGEWWEAGLCFRRTRAYGVLHGAPRPDPTADRPRLHPLGRVRYDGARRDYEVHLGGSRRWAEDLPVDLTPPNKSADYYKGNKSAGRAAGGAAAGCSAGVYADTGPPPQAPFDDTLPF